MKNIMNSKINAISDMHQDIRSDLQSIASDKRKKSTLTFFKHDIKCHGVSNPDTQKIGRKYIAILKREKKEFVWSLCEKLFLDDYLEESLLACQLVFALKKQYDLEDFVTFERWVALYINNWAECDTFCNKVIGEMLFKFPSLVESIKNWSLSENLWVRRASAVSFIYPAKKNTYVADQFDIALILLEDKEDMVQKGYGWMLKVLSQVRQQEVFDFIQTFKARMPRTALRYAIEKMPHYYRTEAMHK
jgi:3-methyladenine DNA glycosylase AlkD